MTDDMNKLTFDEICESQDFEHSQEFITIESHNVAVAEMQVQNSTLKAQLELAVKALQFYGDAQSMYESAYECEGPCYGYIPELDDFEIVPESGYNVKHIGKRARSALAQINQLDKSKSMHSLKYDLEQGVKK